MTDAAKGWAKSIIPIVVTWVTIIVTVGIAWGSLSSDVGHLRTDHDRVAVKVESDHDRMALVEERSRAIEGIRQALRDLTAIVADQRIITAELRAISKGGTK